MATTSPNEEEEEEETFLTVMLKTNLEV